MWVSKKEYDKLFVDSKMKVELEKEVERLAELITSQTKDCQLGPWCRDCEHFGHDKSVVGPILWSEKSFNYVLCDKASGVVVYCKKHLHQMCKEFERKQ